MSRHPSPPDGNGGGSGGTNSSGSQDPNEKTTVGYGAQGYVVPATDFVYTIYFENMASATAPAQQVFVTDALSPLLDWSSLEPVGIGFNRIEVDVPPGLNQLEPYRRVDGSLPGACAGEAGRHHRHPDPRDRADRPRHGVFPEDR